MKRRQLFSNSISECMLSLCILDSCLCECLLEIFLSAQTQLATNGITSLGKYMDKIYRCESSSHQSFTKLSNIHLNNFRLFRNQLEFVSLCISVSPCLCSFCSNFTVLVLPVSVLQSFISNISTSSVCSSHLKINIFDSLLDLLSHLNNCIFLRINNAIIEFT